MKIPRQGIPSANATTHTLTPVKVNALAAEDAAYCHLRQEEPFLWLNPKWQPTAVCLDTLPFSASDIADAEARWHRCAPLLEKLFPIVSSRRVLCS